MESRVVISCDGNPHAAANGRLDYSEQFRLKTLVAFPLLFPTGDYATYLPPDEFFAFTEDSLLTHHAYQRLRGPAYGYVFQEMLATMRLQKMTPEQYL